MILPGFVNAHTHLEYAVYAGFGDGLEFADWLRVHVERKRLLDWDATVAIARAGAAACLTGGMTTVADASFNGAAAVAAGELGLRAIIHLEVFGDGAGELTTRFEPNRERIEGSLSSRVRLGVSPHSPATASVEALPCVPGARAAGRHPRRGERRGTRVARARHRSVGRVRRPPPAPAGRDGRARPRAGGSAVTGCLRRPLRARRRRGDRAPRRPRRRRRPLPPLERPARLRDRAARAAAGRRAAGRARHGQPRVDTVVRRLRGDARGDPARQSRHAPARGRSTPRAPCASRRSDRRRCSASPGRSARSSPGSGQISRSSRCVPRPTCPGRTRWSRSCTAARPSASPVPSWMASSGTTEEVPSGTSYEQRRPPPAAGCSRPEGRR